MGEGLAEQRLICWIVCDSALTATRPAKRVRVTARVLEVESMIVCFESGGEEIKEERHEERLNPHRNPGNTGGKDRHAFGDRAASGQDEECLSFSGHSTAKLWSNHAKATPPERTQTFATLP